MKVNEEELKNLLNGISLKYYEKIIKYVNKKLLSSEEAEDLVQDIMYQIIKNVKLEYEGNREIKKMDHFVMMIAKKKWVDYVRKDKRLRNAVFHEKINKSTGITRETIIQLRHHVAQLNFKHREAMIMRYIEKIPLKQIAEKLNTTEGYVKQLLHDGRDMLRKRIKENPEDYEYNYRPDYLRMTLSGEGTNNPDILRINESLTKQHICIVCYQEPCTIDKIGKMTGLPKAVIEYDLEWLIEKDFIKQKKNLYSTNSLIIDSNTKVHVLNLYAKYKNLLSDRIVEELRIYENEIRKINFLGSDMPYEKLLWFLIYSFTDYASKKICNEKTEINYDLPLRADGGHYVPIGFQKVKPHVQLDSFFTEKYSKLYNWESDGTYLYQDGENYLKWLGLKKSARHVSNKVAFNYFIPDVMLYKNVLFKAVKPNFKIDNLTESERLIISQLIYNKWLSISDKENKITPNFCVFNIVQRKQTLDLFDEIYIKMKPVYNDFFEETKKVIKKLLPLHLHQYKNYSIFLSLLISHVITIGFAYYDGKIYKPKDEEEFSRLTLSITASDKEITSEKSNFVLFYRTIDI